MKHKLTEKDNIKTDLNNMDMSVLRGNNGGLLSTRRRTFWFLKDRQFYHG